MAEGAQDDYVIERPNRRQRVRSRSRESGTLEMTVFLIDDDTAVRDSLKLLLETRGLAVKDFSSGPEMLEESAPDPADCIVCALLEATLRSLLKSVSGNELLNSLSEEQARELTLSLREVHAGINSILNKNAMVLLKRKPLFGRLVNRIEEQTEDLYDIIEDLVLADNSDFRKMVAGCVEKLSIDRSPEPVGHM